MKYFTANSIKHIRCSCWEDLDGMESYCQEPMGNYILTDTS